jgi:hypothetical protein
MPDKYVHVFEYATVFGPSDLFDCHGIVVLRGVLNATEIADARGAITRTRQPPRPRDQQQYSGILDEPALEALITHPRLLPVLLELMAGEPHLTSVGALHKDPSPPVAAGLRPGGAAQMHCQREYGRDHAHFAVRPVAKLSAGGESESDEGRIYADNLVVFPYFTDCRPGDGGLIIVRTSLSLQRRVGPAH